MLVAIKRTGLVDLNIMAQRVYILQISYILLNDIAKLKLNITGARDAKPRLYRSVIIV